MKKRPRKPKLPTLEKTMQTAGDYQDCAARLKALADPERLRIVSCLMSGPKNVSQLAHELDDEVVKVSHHLGVLRHARVVRAEKQGKFVIYRLDPAIAGREAAGIKTLDLGCCRLDLPKPSG
jgi:DNA-binding transcriptional ArsR family regulator